MPFEPMLQSNSNRRLVIPKFTKDAITAEMKNLRSTHCAHVYKFTCPKTMNQKLCNAIMTNK